MGDDARAVESVVDPEIGGERMVRGGGDDAIFEGVAGGEAENADGFDADVVIGRKVDDGGVGIIGDGAGENVGSAAARVGDADEGNLDLLEGTVVVEIEVTELLNAQFGTYFDHAMNLFA